MGKVEGKKRRKYGFLLGIVTMLFSTSLFYSAAQYYKSELKAPSPSQTVAPKDESAQKQQKELPYPIKQAAPQTYEDLLSPQETPIDLRQPKNIESHAEYDPITRTYVIRTKVGDREIVTPFI